MEIKEEIKKRVLLAVKMKEMRLLMNMSTNDAAKLIGVQQSNYSHMEKGRQNISDERYLILKNQYLKWVKCETKLLKNKIKHINSL